MPGGYPLYPDLVNGQGVGANASISMGTQVNGGAANTKGSWTQLISASAYDACAILVSLQTNDNYGAGGVANYLVDIGIGPSGSEKVLIPNLLMSNTDSGGRNNYEILLPITIKAGTRIAARCQNNSAYQNFCFVNLVLFDGSFSGDGFAGADDLGTAASVSSGTALAISTADTLGAWTQIVAATSRDYEGFACSWGNNGNTDNKTSFLFNIGVGPSGSEKIILPGLLGTLGNQLGSLMGPKFFPIKIPAGSRIAAQCQGNSNGSALTAGPRLLMHGIF